MKKFFLFPFKIILPFVVFLTVSGCWSERTKVYWHESDSYVFEYIGYEDIMLENLGNGEIAVMCVPSHFYGAFSQEEPQKSEYKSKCAVYNDFGYHFKYFNYGGSEYEHSVPDRDFSKIEIYSDRDYVEGYPAGSSLSSLFYMASRSPYKFIKDRYENYTVSYPLSQDDYPEYYHKYRKNRGILAPVVQMAFPLDVTGVYPVYGILSEMTEDDMKLLGFGDRKGLPDPCEIFTLYPRVVPDDKSEHELRVELTDTDGEVLTATLKVDFSEVQPYK